MREKALDFAKRKLAVTYLVCTDSGKLAGAFTIANKYTKVPVQSISNTLKNRIRQFANLDEGDDSYATSAYLFAQFGKHDDLSEDCLITGNELMYFVMEVISSVQNKIGGKMMWLECEEDNLRALQFYAQGDKPFKMFGKRDSDDGTVYVQMLKLL